MMVRGRVLDYRGVLILAATMVFLPAVADAETYLKGKLTVTVDSPPTCNSTGTYHGYAEYRLRVVNDDAVPHSLRFYLPGEKRFGSVLSLERSVNVAAGARAVVSILQPPIYIDGSGVRLEIDGRTEDTPISVTYVPHVSTLGGSSHMLSYRPASFLCCREISQQIRDRLQNTSTGYYGYGNSVSRSETSAADWSDSWLAYSRFDALVLTAGSMRQLKPASLDAIVRYVECGGCLIVLGDGWTPPESFTADANADRYCAGFGMCLVSRSEYALPDDWKEFVCQTPQAFAEAMMLSNRYLNECVPVNVRQKVSGVGLFALVLVVAVLIGPAGLIFFIRVRRRMWYLWAVPIISLIACGAIVVFSIITEGWTGWRSNAVLTVLDQNNHRATSLGYVGFYSPMTPGDGLHFDNETELVFPGDDTSDWTSSRHSASETDRTISWDSDQHLVSGWIKARQERYFGFRKSQTRRERVDFVPGDQPRILNGLGVKIRRIIIADEAGKVYAAENVAAGQEIAVVATNQKIEGTSQTLRKLFGGFSRIAEKLKEDKLFRAANLRPGTYIAELEGQSPFVEDGLKKSNLRTSLAMVYGILATQPSPVKTPTTAPAGNLPAVVAESPPTSSPSSGPVLTSSPSQRPATWPVASSDQEGR